MTEGKSPLEAAQWPCYGLSESTLGAVRLGLDEKLEAC
jgi:hypothetical protein